MTISIETSRYDSTLFGKPWIALVDFSASDGGEFTYQKWIGDPGEEGLLVIPAAQAGDIVARGQKKYGAPGHENIPRFYEVTEDGDLKALKGRAEAYLRFHETNGACGV